jgi:hypothetical protein
LKATKYWVHRCFQADLVHAEFLQHLFARVLGGKARRCNFSGVLPFTALLLRVTVLPFWLYMPSDLTLSDLTVDNGDADGSGDNKLLRLLGRQSATEDMAKIVPEAVRAPTAPLAAGAGPRHTPHKTPW